MLAVFFPATLDEAEAAEGAEAFAGLETLHGFAQHAPGDPEEEEGGEEDIGPRAAGAVGGEAEEEAEEADPEYELSETSAHKGSPFRCILPDRQCLR